MPRNILNELQAKKFVSLDGDELDELFKDAAEVVIQYDRASASLIQRRLSIGYARAARLIDQLESAGILGPADGARPREVLLTSTKNLKIKRGEQEKEEIQEQPLKYNQPKLSIIQKPKENPWKYSLFDAFNDKSFKNMKKYSFPVGFTDDKKLVTADLDDIKHLIIGGYSLSQKEVMLDTILTSLLVKESPRDLRLILIDSTRYLNFYNNLPHLLSPVINDMDKSISAFRWLMSEADRRLKNLSIVGKRDVESFNSDPPSVETSDITEFVSETNMPHILLVINQIEDCTLFSPLEVEDALSRILMLAPRCGVHVIFTANHLTKQFVPTGIQSEIPNRLLFRFTSHNDAGSGKVTEVEKLQPGKALYESDNNPTKLDVIYTSDENIKNVVKEIIK